MKHADVPTALELVVEEVGKESQRIREAGGEALKVGKLKPAKKAIEYAEKLAAFVEKVRALGDEWDALQVEMAEAAPEVQEIVQFPKPQKQHKTGFTRTVETVAPKTNFSVTFSDGVTIVDKQAKVVFAKTIEKIGADAVAPLNLKRAVRFAYACGGWRKVCKETQRCQHARQRVIAQRLTRWVSQENCRSGDMFRQIEGSVQSFVLFVAARAAIQLTNLG